MSTRLMLFLLLPLAACVRTPAAPPTGQPSPALRTALADTSIVSRVYMPQEVASRAYRKHLVRETWTSDAAPASREANKGSLAIAANENDDRRRGAGAAIITQSRGRSLEKRFPSGSARARAIVERSGWVNNATIEIVSASDTTLPRFMMQWMQSQFEPARDSEDRKVRQLIDVTLDWSRIVYRDTLRR